MNENSFNQKMLGISCDLGVDESCMVGYTVDMGGNIKIDWIKNTKKKKKENIFNNMCITEYAKTIKKLTEDPLIKKMLKEVKKVKSYFETEIVKGKKEKKEIVGDICIKGYYYPIYKNKHNRIYFKSKKEKKGNWVNGENLDKIKFPCFCRWNNNGWIGMLIKDWKDDEAIYTIVRVDRQTVRSETYGGFKDLKEFIKAYNIHILKGKIILYEEE